MTANVSFNWEYNYPYADEVQFTLYENDVPVEHNIGVLRFSLLMGEKPFGIYNYHVTANRFGVESEPSNTVAVNFMKPASPQNLTFILAG